MVVFLPLLESETTAQQSSTQDAPVDQPSVVMPTQWHNTQPDLSATIWHKSASLDDSNAAESPAAECAASAEMEWDWGAEHQDRRREVEDDRARDHLADIPLIVDRTLLRSLLAEILGRKVVRITFLSSGTFHKAYLVKLCPTPNNSRNEVIARVARRFMPRLKTESEVATMAFLKTRLDLPVPEVLHYDSNPWNRLGGEFIVMTKAPGVPLSTVYQCLSYSSLMKLMENLALLTLKVWGHRFEKLGSLYFGPTPLPSNSGMPAPSETGAMPRDKSAPLRQFTDLANDAYTAPPFSPTLISRTPSGQATPRGAPGIARTRSFPSTSRGAPFAMTSDISSPHQVLKDEHDDAFHVGPIVSWPFFGSNRGFLGPGELDRGPYPTFESYLQSCQEREINGVIRESEGRSAPHRLHLDPAEIRASRHHRVSAIPGDESDDSDEYDGVSESEDEWEGPGDAMYRDYRRNQRTTFLISQIREREERVREEMARYGRLMIKLNEICERRVSNRLRKTVKAAPVISALRGIETSIAKHHEDGFGLDCHDLSLENIFVDEAEPSRITCVIDWESTTTRPLWACAHLPAFLQSSPFTARIFRNAVASIAKREGSNSRLSLLAQEWLLHESEGTRLRAAHRFIEWDGWEEGLAESILGGTEEEEGWLADSDEEEGTAESRKVGRSCSVSENEEDIVEGLPSPDPATPLSSSIGVIGRLSRHRKPDPRSKGKKALPSVVKELLGDAGKEMGLDGTGDFCGGRGGELGRRLEAWLHDSGSVGAESSD